MVRAESLRILLKYDYQVLVASSVAEGLTTLQNNQIDTIILDNRMPGRTGLEGLGDLRAVDEGVSIIMLTGYGTLETACEAFRNQATDFMTKPPDTDAMLEAVAKNVTLTRAKRERTSIARELAEFKPEPLRRTARNPAPGQARAAFRRDHSRHGQSTHDPDLLRRTAPDQGQRDASGKRYAMDRSPRLHPDDQKERPALLQPLGRLAPGARRHRAEP